MIVDVLVLVIIMIYQLEVICTYRISEKSFDFVFVTLGKFREFCTDLGGFMHAKATFMP